MSNPSVIPAKAGIQSLLTWHDLAFAAAVAAMLVVAIVFMRLLPATVPTHWGIDGQPNGWGSPAFALFMPIVMAAFIWIILMAAPLADPFRANLVAAKLAYGEVRLALGVFAVVLQLGTVLSNFYPTIMSVALAGSIGMLFVVIGRNLPRVGRNHTMGMRLPATLASDEVWARTHRDAGRYFMLAGFVVILGAALPPAASFAVLMLAILAAVIGSILAMRRAAKG